MVTRITRAVVRTDACPVGAYRAQVAAVEWIRLADVVRVMNSIGWDPGVGMFFSLVSARERFEAARTP